MFARDGSLRVCNFRYDDNPTDETSGGEAKVDEDEKLAGLINDAEDFGSLVALAHTHHEPRRSFKHRLNDYTLFHRLLKFSKDNKYANPREFVEKVSSWIYNASCFWNAVKVDLFFDAFNDLLNTNKLKLRRRHFLARHFKKWRKRVKSHGEGEMYDCYYFKEKKKRKAYKWDFGIIRFLRNYKTHYRSCRYAAIRDVMELFPQLLGCSYCDLFFKLKHLNREDKERETFGEYFRDHFLLFQVDKP